MPSRADRDVSAHLRRTKSVASVKQRRVEQLTQDPVNPDTARIHAVTAAHIAMGRATERTSIEMRRSADLAKCDGSANRPSIRPTARSQTILFSPASELRRQRSILQSKGPSIVPSCHNPNDHFDADLSHYAAPPPSELGIMDRRDSEPSSYRKLRQVKSVIIPRKRATSMYSTPSCRPSSVHTVQNGEASLGEAEQGLKLGLKRSMSFLRDNSSGLSKAFKRRENTRQHDEAIHQAQEQFLSDLEQQRLRKKTSFFSLPRTRQQHKVFQKTMQSKRTTEFGDGVKSENQASHSSQPETKSRSLAASFRDKMKHVFGRSISNKDKFPAQQLDASRPYFRDCIDGSGTESALDRYFVGDNDATAFGSLYMPSSHECDSLGDLDRMSPTMRSAQSMESLYSNSRSRVTSWTNSAITNSIPTRSTPLERKRLSIIKEDSAPHRSSSSIGRHLGVEVFRKPLTTQNGYGQPTQPIDGQRLYSALMKRVDQEQADAESPQVPGPPASQEANFPPSSAQSCQTDPTIRAVPSDASLCAVAPDGEYRQFSNGTTCWHEDSGMTPQELAQHNENLERRGVRLAEQEEQSPFYPFSKQSESQTRSPFKLALTARKENSGTSQSDPDSGVVTHPTNSPDQVYGKFTVSSDSIYSRTTGGHTVPHDLSGRTSPEDTDESPSVGGTAAIIPTKVSCYPRPTPSLVQLHRARSIERGEWKGRIENQMTSLGHHHSRVSRPHHREGAQVDGDDTAVGGRGERPTKSTGFATELGRHGSQRTIRGSINENRKVASFASLKELTPTPKQRLKSQMSLSNWNQFGKNVTSDLDRNLLRLSRPFDTDIPDGNPPFDSEYLGTEQSYGIGGKAGRLSVARVAAASTGTPGYYGDDEGEDTALPKIEEKGANNENRTISSGKRMVSNFLRSRKKNTPVQGQVDGEETGSSPAFV